MSHYKPTKQNIASIINKDFPNNFSNSDLDAIAGSIAQFSEHSIKYPKIDASKILKKINTKIDKYTELELSNPNLDFSNMSDDMFLYINKIINSYMLQK